MEGSGAGASWLDVTKTKILVLSSILGLGTIIYFTKNYIERGHFLPQLSHSNKKSNIKQPKIIGGKHNVVIKEDITAKDGVTRKVVHRQRSRQSSTCSSHRRGSVRGSSKGKRVSMNKDKMDINLNNAINELSDSVKEVEEILGMNSGAINEKQLITGGGSIGNHIIEDEIKKLRKLLDFAQDVNSVTDRTTEYVMNHQQIVEDIVPVEEPELFQEHLEMLCEINDDYDSDNDSFISAVDSLDLELSDEEEYESAVQFSVKLKELINKHSKNDFYMQGIEYLTHYGIPVRSMRTELLACDNDIDFCVKVYCLRRAFLNILKDEEHKKWFVESGKEMLFTLLKEARYDYVQFSSDYDEMMNYCNEPQNWSDIDIELTARGVCNLNFYDIVLDLLIMDSFEDLDNPPSAVTAAIQNRWLSVRIKETALSTAIWTVIKAKKHRLENQNGFFAKFYDISMYLTPALAWGFLGPVQELNNLCTQFKDSMLSFLRDIFSIESANYKTVQTLAEDILDIAKKRKQELMAAITS